MPPAKSLSASSLAGRARSAHRLRERARRRLAARVRVRQRQAVTFAVLAGAFILIGGMTGAYLARKAERAVPNPGAAALRLPSDPGAGVPQAAPAPAAGAHGSEVHEAALARLYEEPLEPVAAFPAEPEPAVAAEADLALLDLPDVPAPRRALWERNAVPVAVPPGRPMIAIVLDDLGLNRPGSRRAVALPGPLTLSLMTYAEDLRGLAAGARAAGHELLLHVPMEPRDADYDPGPNVLAAELTAGELRRRLEWGLGRFEGFVGINNHMGSKFTTSAGGLALVMRELKSRGLLFLDSMTSPGSVGRMVAGRTGVPFARRDVFLDNDWTDRAAIRRQIARLEDVARRRGYAVGIGHPHRATLDVLAEWLPQARRRGFVLVPISAIVRHRIEIARNVAANAG